MSRTIYCIESGSEERVSSWVNINLSRGWQLNGNVSLYHDRYSMIYAQSMFKVLTDEEAMEHDQCEKDRNNNERRMRITNRLGYEKPNSELY